MWKDVIGYEGLYKVNECGDIYSVPHLRKNGSKGSYVSSPRIMKQRINRSGYSIIRLSKKGNVKDEFVHVIVLYKKYHKILKERGLTNGQIDLEYSYIEKIFKNCQTENKFL